MFKIDKGIPLPDKAGETGRKKWFPWEDMQVGDSFFAAGYGIGGTKQVRAKGLKHLTTSNARKLIKGSKWATKMMEKDGVVGVRVWRVS